MLPEVFAHKFELSVVSEFYRIATLGEAAIREKIAEVQAQLDEGIAAGKYTAVDLEPVNTFAPQVYLRELTIPKGQLIVGKIHRHAHFNFLSKGSVSVLTKDGAVHYQAPCQMVSSAGTQRLLYTHEETTWTVIHPNPMNLTNVDELEAMHIAKDYSEFPLPLAQLTFIEGEI